MAKPGDGKLKSSISGGPSNFHSLLCVPLRGWHCRRRNGARSPAITSLKSEQEEPSQLEVLQACRSLYSFQHIHSPSSSHHAAANMTAQITTNQETEEREQINEMWHIWWNVVETAASDQIGVFLEFMEAFIRPLQRCNRILTWTKQFFEVNTGWLLSFSVIFKHCSKRLTAAQTAHPH